MRFRAPALTVLVLALCCLALSPLAAELPDPPPFYAIRDARVVVGNGQVLERATVLIADGLIEAVGTDLAIPADAWVYDGSGLSLYPGLIDGLTDFGLQKKEDSGSGSGSGSGPGGRQQRDQPPVRGPEDRPGTFPWRNAADELAEDGRMESWREAGFTAALTVPQEGYLPGSAALVHLGTAEPGERVLAARVAHGMQLDPKGGFRTFPGSLMGVFAHLRQTFSDARHYGTVRALYAAGPLGRQRLPYDRSLDPLLQALETGMPFLVPADSASEIDRALRLREEHRLQAILVGGQGAYTRIETLRKAGLPVIVDLDWPEAERDRDPDQPESFRTLAHRRLAPTVPRLLAEAGVPFAFTSGGASSPGDAFKGVRAALDAGLSEEAALSALTLSAAKILGVENRLGSIEKGKIAHLVLADAPPWSEDVAVSAVFVDGRLYPAESEDEEPGEAPAQDVSGTWALSLTTPGGVREMTARLEMDDDGKVRGEIEGEQDSRPLEDGRMSGDTLRFKTSQSRGGRSFQASYSLAVEGERLDGTMSAGPMSMDLTGERTARVAEGESKEEGEGDAEPAVSESEVREALALYWGPVETLGTFAITNATVYTVSGETLEGGTVVVANGKIRAVGRNVSIPAGAKVIDAQGGSLIPGIIDAHSHIATDGGGNEGTLNVSAMVGIEDVIDPTDVGIYRALAGGVTTVNILHGSANPIGGKNAVIKTRWGGDADALRFEGAPPGIKFALGENPKRSGFSGSEPRFPSTRMGVIEVVREAFREAAAYREEQRRYEAARRTRGQKPTPPRIDYELEALAEILEGERLVHAHSYRADEILQLLRLAEELGFRIATFQHALEGYKVADELADHGAGASVFSDWWGYKVEAYDAIPYNAALMTERGVVVSINSDSAEEMRHLNQEAAKSMRWGGLSELEALRLVTLNPARQLGIAGSVGSIEVGKDADLVLLDGPPLALTSVVQKTFVDGDLYFDRAADRERQAKIDEIKQRLGGGGKKEGGGEDGAPPEQPAEPEHFPYTCRGEH